ncbi:hypothetical protein FQN50_003655 [Emmonsiellopsis sp. PD_5]|nr:hypothetical protein FQN50_003655 [Emmonsiellopsis sp. PD_5]
MPAPTSAEPLQESILIVGGGVFGLSTALALAGRHSGKITVVESSPTIPNPHGSSVDSSRIIRADYANPQYSALAEAALEKWRYTEWGREGRYTQNGLVLLSSGDKHSSEYARKSYENVRRVDPSAVELLSNRDEVIKAAPAYGSGLHVEGGYVNWKSGWADAEASVRFAKQKIDETGRVEFRTGDVKRLLLNATAEGRKVITGVELADNSTITADLVILATGAWTSRLIDLRGKADATGQVLAYIRISDQEQAALANIPTVLNFSTGMFIIPPRNNLLKIARHAYGYRNPTRVPAPAGIAAQTAETIEVSLPENGVPIPPEGEEACRTALREMLPAFAERPFEKTRVCWYTDTPHGDFIITHHPSYSGLFLATGGSGHGFKFLPVIGEKIVDAIQGKLDPALRKLWAWSEEVGQDDGDVVWTEDGSRSGLKGLVLREELAKAKGKGRGSKL